ncbi:MAG: GTP cyclohydrolase FolE2 [Deltaproteobacteria bacterium]|jgi:GTP cyclohydrolase I|nr:GTP cyclohydrolase FolE2 [Deltaproteobacteria bacterium]
MEDIQKGPADVAVPVDRVGVRGMTLPLVVRDRVQGRQHTVAEADLGVELPADFKGTHMSRFVEALENFNDELDYASLKHLLEDVKTRLEARKAYVLFRFPYFVRKAAPATGSFGIMRYECSLTGELDEGRPVFVLGVDVPVMTVCPCSKAISNEGAHSQRAVVRMAVRMVGFAWIEDFVAIAETSASSSVYTLLKREDEKYVTENAFAHPAFVEDVVRGVADALSRHPHIEWFRVEVESFESIHAHNAFARIERLMSR